MDYCLLCNKSGEEVEALYTHPNINRNLCIGCAEAVVKQHAKNHNFSFKIKEY